MSIPDYLFEECDDEESESEYDWELEEWLEKMDYEY
jgi:hypothetical protein